MTNWHRFGSAGSLSALLLAGGLAVADARAESTALGGSGWTASWDETKFDVRFEVNLEEPGLLAIRKIIDHVTLEPVPVTFTPANADAIPVIEVLEQLTNSTGTAWTGYVFAITHPPVSAPLTPRFDVAATDVGGPGGFDPDPFANAVFEAGDLPRLLTVDGGAPVGDGAVWQPGGLVIDTRISAVNLGGFTLTETPTVPDGHLIPTPTAAALGAALFLGLLHRRREA